MEVMLRRDRGRLAKFGNCRSRMATMELWSSCESVSRLNFVVVVMILEARDRKDSVAGSSWRSRTMLELVIGMQLIT